MIDQILSTIAAGGDPSEIPEIDAALEDGGFRSELLATAVERFQLAEQIPEEALSEMSGSVDGIRQFLGGLSMFLDMASSMEAGLEPSPAPVDTVEDPRPAPTASVSEQELEEAARVLSTCFYLGHCFGDSVSIEADGFVLPNYDLAAIQVDWTSAKGPAGEIPLAAEQRAPFGDGRLNGDGQVNFELSFASPPEDNVVTHAAGRGTLSVPTRVATIGFAADQVDAAKSTEGIAATLKSCTNDCVAVSIEGIAPGTACRVIARDAEGRRLSDRESQTMTRDGYEANLRYAGTVASVEVCVVLENATRSFEARATREPDSNSEGLTVAEAARFLPPRREANFVSMSSDELLDELEFRPGRDYSSMEFNQPAVHLYLPRVDNSAFAELEWKDVRPVDAAGNEIPHQIAQRGYDDAMHWDSISFESEEYGGEPIELSMASGKVAVRYPLAVATVTATRDAPEAGVIRAAFDGSVVTLTLVGEQDADSPIDLSWISWRAGRAVSTVDAFDAEGRRLKPLSWSSSSGNALRLPYWGEPASVRVSLPTEWDDIELQFDVGPAPKLPEEQRGMQPGCRA